MYNHLMALNESYFLTVDLIVSKSRNANRIQHRENEVQN